MQVRLLGPVDVAADGVSRPVSGLRRKAVLAVLALSCGEIVSTERIADVIWGTAPPKTAVNTVQSHVSYLRQVLGSKAAILARAPGYVLDLGGDATDEATDVQAAERLIRQGAESADPAERARCLRAAMALWRGRPLADVAGVAWLEEQADILDQLWLRASRALIETRLKLGEHAQLVAELEGLTAEYPFDEQMHAQLILALYRAGRQADALAAYDRLRRRLGDDLGIEPSEPLRDLHAGLLRQDPALDLPAPSVARPRPAPVAPVPAQLPPAVTGFAGRGAELARLDAVLAGAAGEAASVVISAVSGTAGVGKTALAVHWAHRVAARFPDGQLYVNLRGFDPGGPALDPAEAIRGFLDALGVPVERIPAGLPAQAGLYRSLLAGQQVLVVLDNARDAAQARPLLPGSPGCLALVTSRSQLLPLVAAEGAHHLTLDLLTAAEARHLLAGRLGAARLAAEPDAADDIIARCAGLPLALAIAAARAVTHPDFPLAALAAELRASTAALDAFERGDPATDVRAVFSWSYRMLSAGAARLFRLLGMPAGPDIGVAAAASLAGLPLERARAELAELARAHLLTEPAPGRYTFHDLLRAYAAEQARGQDGDDSGPAGRRLLDHYLHAGRAAAMIMNPVRAPAALPPPRPGVTCPPITDYQQALTWFAAERAVLLDIIGQAPPSGDDVTWRLASDLTTFLDRQGHWHDLNAVQTAALAAATRLGDRTALAHAHRGLGIAQAGLKLFDDARAHYLLALDLFAEQGDHVGQAQTSISLSWISGAQGRRREALDFSRQGLEQFQAAGSAHGQAVALANIGWYHAELGDYHEALVCCQQGLALARELGNLNDQAHICDSIAYIHHHLGHHRRAILHYHEALELFRMTGDRNGEASGLARLGDVHHAIGEIGAARQAWQAGLEILDQLQHPEADQVRAKLRARDDPSIRASFSYPAAQPR